MTDKSRLEHLRAMVEGAESRMLSETCSDQNYAVLGRMRAEFLAQIEVLDPASSASAAASETAVDEFTKRRKGRSAS